MDTSPGVHHIRGGGSDGRCSPSCAHARAVDHQLPHSGDTSTTMAPVSDDYLILVRFDGKVQCINLHDGMDAWCLTSGPGDLCAYEQKTPGTPKTPQQPPPPPARAAPVSKRGEPVAPSVLSKTLVEPSAPAGGIYAKTSATPSVALQTKHHHHSVPVMLAGFRSHATCSHTYVLSGDGNLVLADDHRLLNQDILVHSLQSFNTNDSNYFEVRLRSGEVLTEGLDDARRLYTPNGPHPSMDFEDVLRSGGGAGPVLAIVRHNKTHTGRVRTKPSPVHHKSPSSSTTTTSSSDSANDASPATRVWKFSSGTVSIVDLDSPSLRVLPHDGLNAGTLPLMLRAREDSHEELHNSGGSSFTSPTVTGSRRSYPSSPSRRKPSTVEVYVDGSWFVTSSAGADATAGQQQACWWSGAIDDSEVVKAYHYCSAFEGDEKLHEVPVGIFRDAAASSTRDRFTSSATAATGDHAGAASATAGGCLDDQSETHLYLKPDSNFVFIVGEVPVSYHVRAFMEQAPTVSRCGGREQAWKVRLPRAAMQPSAAAPHGQGLTGGHPLRRSHLQQRLGIKANQSEGSGGMAGLVAPVTRPMITVGPVGERVPCQEVPSTLSGSATTATVLSVDDEGSDRQVPLPTALGSKSATRASMLFLQDDSDEEAADNVECISVTTTADVPRRVTLDDETRSSEATPLRRYRPAPSEHTSTSITTTANNNNNGAANSVAFFDEHFEPLRLLGQGASGVVVLCRQRVTGMLYAIKMVITQSKFDEEEVLREVKLHAALMCDNVVRYHSCWTEIVSRRRAAQMRKLLLQGNKRGVMTGVDSASDEDDEDDELMSLASSSSGTTVSSLSRNVGHKAMMLQMEYCNTTLDVRLALRRAIDRVENMAVAMQLINGVMHLHERGIVHRDIKPSNVMLLIDGEMADELSDNVLAGDLHAHARHISKVDGSQMHQQHHRPSSHAVARRKIHGADASSSIDENDGHGTSDDDEDDDDDDGTTYHAPFVVKIGDLGLAKFQGASDQQPGGYFAASELHTVGVGSPIYSSPEQLQGKRCHATGDIFSMGILLAELYLKPTTIAERLDVLLKARERNFAQATLEAYPELKVARAMLHPIPEKRLTLAKAKKRLRDVLATLVKL